MSVEPIVKSRKLSNGNILVATEQVGEASYHFSPLVSEASFHGTLLQRADFHETTNSADPRAHLWLKITNQVDQIVRQLEKLHIDHGHSHSGNFCVKMGHDVPVVRLVDWDRARIVGPAALE